MAGPSTLSRRLATIDDMTEAAQVTDRTVWNWVKRSLLPQPKAISRGRQGRFARWNREDVEIARFIDRRRAQGYNLDEIKEMLGRGETEADYAED